MSHLWHGFTNMADVKDMAPFMISRGEGPYLFNSQGKRFLDASAGLWFCNVGHGRQELADAAARQMGTFASYSTFGNYTNEPAEELANRLAKLSPTHGSSVFFTSGGSDSVDSAIKLVRRFFQVQNQPERRIIVSREYAYHGAHMGSTALGGITLDREGYGELIRDTARIPWDSAEAFEQLIASVGGDKIAAFIAEPVIAAGGVLAPPVGYLQRISELCREHGIVFIADEVVTGFGRVGEWFACQRFGITPDIIVCAKGMTSGYMPFGALIVGDRVSTPFYDGSAGPWFHGYTWSGHAVGAAVAIANLDIVESEGLAGNVMTLEPQLYGLLSPLLKSPLVKDIRTGTGLMAAIVLEEEVLAARPGLTNQIAAEMRNGDVGVLTRSLVGGELQFSPPLTIGTEQVNEFVESALAALGKVG